MNSAFQLNKQVHTCNLALSKEDGILSLFDYEDNDGSAHASLHEDVIELLHNGKSKHYTVNVTSLDSYIEKMGIKCVDLLKIDTEGHELDVLRGSQKALNSFIIKSIHFEFNEMNIFSKATFYDFFIILKNYNLYRILNNGELVHIDKYEPTFCEIYAYQNIVAILREK